MTAAIKKLTPTMTFWQPPPSQNFLRFLTLNLIFLARVRQTGMLLQRSDGVVE
jgi:hypothetical protein